MSRHFIILTWYELWPEVFLSLNVDGIKTINSYVNVNDVYYVYNTYSESGWDESHLSLFS